MCCALSNRQCATPIMCCALSNRQCASTVLIVCALTIRVVCASIVAIDLHRNNTSLVRAWFAAVDLRTSPVPPACRPSATIDCHGGERALRPVPGPPMQSCTVCCHGRSAVVPWWSYTRCVYVVLARLNRSRLHRSGLGGTSRLSPTACTRPSAGRSELSNLLQHAGTRCVFRLVMHSRGLRLSLMHVLRQLTLITAMSPTRQCFASRGGRRTPRRTTGRSSTAS